LAWPLRNELAIQVPIYLKEDFMLEVIKTHNQAGGFNRMSHQAYEVSQFMKNFSEAVHEGNTEEIATYYADDMEPFEFPLNAEWIDETIFVDDHLATFSCCLRSADGASGTTMPQLTCVLDKSEGYWQIIHGEIQKSDNCNH
jgi:hypothetical protein